MSQRKIILLSTLMSFALLGLIYFQVHWIKNALRLQEEEFSQQVREAMVEVVSQLEDQEILLSVKQSQHEVKLESLSITLHPEVPRQNLSENARFKIVDIRASDSLTNAVIPSDQTARRLSMQQSLELTKRLEKKFKRLQDDADLVIKHLEKSSLGTENRLDSLQIDTLLNQAFQQRQLDTKFRWQVVHTNNEKHLLGANNLSSEARPLYQEALFPSDIFKSETMLRLSIPNQKRYVLGQMGLPLASSALLMLTVMGCFGYAVHTIVRQKKLSEMKSDFINNMTHELKTPIATVGMACEALGDPDVAQQPNIQQRYLKIIGQENKRLANQVEKVLQISRLERSRLTLKPEEVDMHTLLKELMETYRLQLEPAGELEAKFRAAQARLIGDRMQLNSIFGNLLDNALKYSGERVRVELESQDTTLNGQPALQVAVRDWGIGIAGENQERIFDKFYRVPTGNLHNVKGFGLGLAFVKYSVEAHRGQIQLHSRPGEGSTFIVKLPLKPHFNEQQTTRS